MRCVGGGVGMKGPRENPNPKATINLSTPMLTPTLVDVDLLTLAPTDVDPLTLTR